MDIVLEFCDTYLLDKVYASALPAQTSSFFNVGFANTTIHGDTKSTSWKYTPASSFISFTPKDAAYMSSWDRDNIYRQAISLFFITW